MANIVVSIIKAVAYKAFYDKNEPIVTFDLLLCKCMFLVRQ